MTIAIATTTITVRRPTATAQSADPWGDGYGTPPQPDGGDSGQPTVVSAGVRATIAPGSARGTEGGGQSESADFRLMCDPIDLSYLDEITDETTGATYRVAWALSTPGVAGLGNTIAGLTTTKGQAS